MYEKRMETQTERSMGKAKASAAMAEQERTAPAVPAAGTTYRDASDHRGLLAPKAVGPKAVVEGKAKEVHFLIHVEDVEVASKDIEETLQLLGGKSIKTVPLGNKTGIDAEIDANKVQEFSDQLHLIGEVQEKGLAMETKEGTVEIRIDLEKTAR
jgi:hypothetical protein